MKKLIILLTMSLSSVSFAAQVADLYFGPVQTCTLSNSENLLETIEISVYTAGIFGPSETVQMVYNFPVLAQEGEPKLSFISLLSTEDVDSGVYTGQFTNVSYLVDVTFDSNAGTLVMVDRETEYEFTGSCSAL